MPERSSRTYEKWVTDRSNPFIATQFRIGRGKARERFGVKEGGLDITVIDQRVEFDAWQLHVMVVDATREQLIKMSEEERKKSPRIRFFA